MVRKAGPVLSFLCLIRLPYDVFRFHCKEEDNDFFYGSGEWLPMKITANHDMQAVSHNCNWPDPVVSGIHVVTTPYIQYWSFYYSTVARNWTVSSCNCTNTTFTPGTNIAITSSGAFVSLVDVYTSNTNGMQVKKVLSLFARVIASQTASTYDLAKHCYLNFCDSFHLPPPPLSEQVLYIIVVYMATSTLRWHNPERRVMCPWLQYALKGIRQVLPLGSAFLLQLACYLI